MYDTWCLQTRVIRLVSKSQLETTVLAVTSLQVGQGHGVAQTLCSLHICTPDAQVALPAVMYGSYGPARDTAGRLC